MTLSTRFYKTAAGRPVVREELIALGPDATAAVSSALARYRRGESLPSEVKSVRRLKSGAQILELRVPLGRETYRALFSHVSKSGWIVLVLTVIHKKTQKLRESDVDRAVARLKDWENRGENT